MSTGEMLRDFSIRIVDFLRSALKFNSNDEDAYSVCGLATHCLDRAYRAGTTGPHSERPDRRRLRQC